jgi:flagellar basal-body rod protein FlgB
MTAAAFRPLFAIPMLSLPQSGAEQEKRLNFCHQDSRLPGFKRTAWPLRCQQKNGLNLKLTMYPAIFAHGAALTTPRPEAFMLGDLPLLAAIKGRMQFHQARQKMLAENVANADTPGFKPRDLKPFDMMMAMQQQDITGSAGPARTQSGHIGGSSGGSLSTRRQQVFESTPSGNAVNLEDEMLRLSQNNSDYQMATTLYSKSMSYLRIALGKRG